MSLPVESPEELAALATWAESLGKLVEKLLEEGKQADITQMEFFMQMVDQVLVGDKKEEWAKEVWQRVVLPNEFFDRFKGFRDASGSELDLLAEKTVKGLKKFAMLLQNDVRFEEIAVQVAPKYKSEYVIHSGGSTTQEVGDTKLKNHTEFVFPNSICPISCCLLVHVSIRTGDALLVGGFIHQIDV